MLPNLQYNFYILTLSRVYGSATESSDWDFIVVTKPHTINDRQQGSPRSSIGYAIGDSTHVTSEIDKKFPVYEDDLVNVSFIPLQQFEHLVLQHKHVGIGNIDTDLCRKYWSVCFCHVIIFGWKQCL
jgi:hypothetical protein